MGKLFYGFVKITGILPYLILKRPKYYYEDKSECSRRLPKNCIIMPNHASVYDYMTMMFTFYGRGVSCITASSTYDKSKMMKFFLRSLGCIKVYRDSYDFSFINKCSDLLEKGYAIELYPEARIPRDDEETPLPYKPSITLLALENNALIIPVVTNYRYKEKKERIKVLIGKKINLVDLYDDSLSNNDNIKKLTEYLESNTKRLYDELKSK